MLQKLHEQIEHLPEAQLIELDQWLQQKQTRKRERILGFAGSWTDLPTETQLEDDLSRRRKSSRRERFDDA